MRSPHIGPDVSSLRHLDDLLKQEQSLRGARLKSLDLTGYSSALLNADVRDTTILGGTVPAAVVDHVVRNGGAIFPAVHHCPINPYRGRLYTAHELYRGLDDGYHVTIDKQAYDWSQDPISHTDIRAASLRALHDAAIDDALHDVVDHRQVVGMMGGHALQRGTDGFRFAAHLAHAVASAGFTIATGGGPGAMEAANLGGWLYRASSHHVDAACDALAEVATFESIESWAKVGLAVRGRHTSNGDNRSISIPTWHYGHEPPNVFSNMIAKYFSNAIREDALLSRSDRAIVYLPGAAGTVQEIFQAATQGYYSDEGGPPLILVGRRYWTSVLPAWPLLQHLAEGRAFARSVYLIDGLDETTSRCVADEVLAVIDQSEANRSEVADG